MIQNTHWKQLARNWASILLGNALYSLAVALFLEPSGLITGGATGIALAIGRLTGLPVSGLLLFINLAMLVWGWAVLGRAFALNTLASSVLSPAFLGLFEGLLAGRVLTEDIFLCTVFSGLGIGVALGLVIRSGASTGGLDIPPLVLNKWFKLPVSATMLTFDIAVLLMQAVFSPVQQVLYGVVMVLIHTIVMDKMLMLGASRTEVKIVSSQSDAICAAILAQLDRGVTILHGEGGYTREPSAVLLSIVSNRELPRLEKLAHSIDPTCFLIVSHVTEVSGRGFSLDKDYLS
ncbi:YitT family protein [Faecalibacterium sp. I3-3-89]|uniref:YitT family protein n=1 Tax=Faecalibacterium sp. I3-3-89 TaxID=2929493 RepID=UPI002014E238|nr:YitT family protein [Faecalibacterium sp. I3-3-89]UQK42771.1 YitT family protein [Faecalibacterium sp. I3-3-89]